MDFIAENTYPKKFIKHLWKCFETNPISDMLKNGPTLESMKMLIQSLMLIRNKLFTTYKTLMHRRSMLNYSTSDSSWCKNDIERSLDSWFLCSNLLPNSTDYFITTTNRALRSDNHDLLRGFEVTIGRRCFTCSAFPKSFVSANIDSLPLIVKIRAVIDKFIVRMNEIHPSPCGIVN